MAFKTMEEHAIISGVNAESNWGSPEKRLEQGCWSGQEDWTAEREMEGTQTGG